MDGADQTAYDSAWAAADVFVSLSDNIQETFGITPLEAMAAGLPVIVSDWNGYKDTVRDGVDGFRIPVIMPSAGTGTDLAMRHDAEIDNYDYYIGRVSMATVIDVVVLVERMIVLAQNRELRMSFGLAGHARVRAEFDWPVILDRYTALTNELSALRNFAQDNSNQLGRLNRPDPFALFAHYPTQILSGHMSVTINPVLAAQIESLLALGISRFVIDPATLPREAVLHVLAKAQSAHNVANLLAALPHFDPSVSTRALMWLVKMGILSLSD